MKKVWIGLGDEPRIVETMSNGIICDHFPRSLGVKTTSTRLLVQVDGWVEKRKTKFQFVRRDLMITR